MVKCMPKSVPDCEVNKVLTKGKRRLDENRSRKVKQAKIDTYFARAPTIESVVQTDDLICLVDIIMKKLNDMSTITQDPPSTPPAEHAANIAMIQEMSKDIVALNNAQHREKLGSAIDNLLKSNVGNSACLILANNALFNIEKCHFQMEMLKNEESTLNDKGKNIAAKSDNNVSSIKDVLEQIQHKEKAAADIVEQIQKLKHKKTILDKEIGSLLSIVNAKVRRAFEDEPELDKKYDVVSQKKLSVEVSKKVTQDQLREKCDLLLDQLKKFSIGFDLK